jgi:hypothetical protein
MIIASFSLHFFCGQQLTSVATIAGQLINDTRGAQKELTLI